MKNMLYANVFVLSNLKRNLANLYLLFLNGFVFLTLFQLQQSPPKHSQCRLWLNGAHPKTQDGVVTRQLCERNKTHDCSKTFDVFVRRCTTYYVYNLRNVHNTAAGFCFQNRKFDVTVQIRGLPPILKHREELKAKSSIF